MDEDNLTYEVVGNSENELYYPLFRISTKDYEFIDEDFRKGFVSFLRTYINAIERK